MVNEGDRFWSVFGISRRGVFVVQWLMMYEGCTDVCMDDVWMYKKRDRWTLTGFFRISLAKDFASPKGPTYANKILT